MSVVSSQIDRILARAVSNASRVLVLSDSPSSRGAAAATGAEVFTRPDGGTFDAVFAAARSVDYGSVRGLTRDGGYAVIDFSTIPASELGHIVRDAVIGLSETGFAIQEPREVRDPAREISSGEGPAVILARADRFRIRKYREGDEREILQLFERAFWVQRSMEHWDWEYRQNPFGTRNMSLVVDEEGRIVVHYAAYPVRIWSDVAPYPTIAVQICDTMTDVGVRHVGRGHTTLLIRAIRHFYATACEEKVAHAFGFNTANIQKICTMYIGGSFIGDVGYWTRSMAPVESRRTSLLSRLVSGAFTAEVLRPSADFDELFARVAPAYGMLIERKMPYLNWRYAASPSAEYVIVGVRRRGRLEGWSVFRRKDDDLVWVDALFDPRTARSSAATALRFALSLPIASGARRMVAWFPARPSWWVAVIRELGFQSETEPNHLGMVAAPFTDPVAPEHLASMYYAAGDSDLF